jgi:hypothetical protein
MLKKTLFVAINRVAAPASAIELFVAEHLVYMNALEADGRLWASGPFIEEGVLVGDGLTIQSTGTIRRGAPDHGRGAAHQARAAHLRAEKMGATRGPDGYLAALVGQPSFALMPVPPSRTGSTASIYQLFVHLEPYFRLPLL